MATILHKLQPNSKANSLKKYTTPKIYHGGKTFDLSRRWYVYYSFLNPNTGEFEQQPPVYDKINRLHKTKQDRLKAVRDLQKAVERTLKKGFSPYEIEEVKNELYYADSALDFALSVKKSEIKETTYKDYDARLSQFKQYLKKNNCISIDQVDKKIVSTFLNKFEPKNSNNFRAALSSVFSVLSDQSLIDFNFVKELRNKKVRKKASVKISEKEILEATKLLKEHDPELLMYVKLISFSFFRPIEIVRLEIKLIDFKNRLMRVDTKGKDLKTKIIPEILFNDLKDFAGKRKGRLFQLTAEKDAAKRGVLTTRFRRFRIRHELNDELTPYVFRYFYITKMYLAIRKKKSKEDTIKELSLITGHESKAIYKYITVNDIELPEDYSDLLK